MERIITSLDQHGRMLIPSSVREKFNIISGDKLALEITDDAIIVKNVDHIVDEMNAIFTKNQNGEQKNIVEDFIDEKRKDFAIEKAREANNE